jgi:glycosyltransferase involved in cell wall biosynthesis
VFAGQTDDVVPYLQAADVFAFPTENEAFGLALVEAMACGLPAVSTLIGGTADVLRPGATGLAVPPGDEGALREAIDRLLGQPELATAMGAHARRVALDEFSAARVVDAYAQLLERLAER